MFIKKTWELYLLGLSGHMVSLEVTKKALSMRYILRKGYGDLSLV